MNKEELKEAATHVWKRVLVTLQAFSDHDYLIRAWINQEYPNLVLSIEECATELEQDLHCIIPYMENYPLTPLQLVRLMQFQEALSEYSDSDNYEKILIDPKWHTIEKFAKALYESIQRQDKTGLVVQDEEEHGWIFQLFIDHLGAWQRTEDLVFKILNMLGCYAARPKGVPEEYQFYCLRGFFGYLYVKDSKNMVIVTYQDAKPHVSDANPN